MAALHWFSLFLIISTTIFVNAGRSKRSPIMTNKVAKLNQFPYAVAIVNSQREYNCSGGIIGGRHILSAAHCFVNETKHLKSNEFVVYANTIDHKSAQWEHHSVVVAVERIFFPRDYDYDLGRADIAIAKLAADIVPHMRNLKILKLPVRNVVIGQKAVVAAFGTSEIKLYKVGNETMARFLNDGKLRYANMTILNNEGHGSPDRNFPIKPYHLLGMMEKDESVPVYGMCYGDSGSCLVQESSHESTVIGVLVDSFSRDCIGERPAIFANVMSYVSSINNVMTHGSSEDMLVRECNIMMKKHAAGSSSNKPNKRDRVAPKKGRRGQ